ncbi:hypothetical protein ACET9F_20375, partial [Aeromonas veronii]
NERSHWSGNGVHVEPESVFMIGRNMHDDADIGIAANKAVFLPLLFKGSGVFKWHCGPVSKHQELAARSSGAPVHHYQIKDSKFGDLFAITEWCALAINALPSVIVHSENKA